MVFAFIYILKVNYDILQLATNYTTSVCVALFIKIRTRRKGIFFKESVKEISAFTGFSPYIIRKYLPMTIKLGLLKRHSGNLCCVGQGRGLRKEVKTHGNLEQIIFNIRTTIFKNEVICKQKYIIDLKSEFISPNFLEGKNERKAFIKAYRKGYLSDIENGRFDRNVKVGYKRLSIILGIQQSKCRAFLKRLVSKGEIFSFGAKRIWHEGRIISICTTRIYS